MAKAQSKQATATNTPRLKQVYNETIRKALQEQFGYDNDMDVIVCTTAKTDDEARALLKAFNFPFRQ